MPSFHKHTLLNSRKNNEGFGLFMILIENDKVKPALFKIQ